MVRFHEPMRILLSLLTTVLLATAATAQHAPVLKRYCYGCHNASLKSGNFALETRLDQLGEDPGVLFDHGEPLGRHRTK